jgi:hypothetical protein
MAGPGSAWDSTLAQRMQPRGSSAGQQHTLSFRSHRALPGRILDASLASHLLCSVTAPSAQISDGSVLPWQALFRVGIRRLRRGCSREAAVQVGDARFSLSCRHRALSGRIPAASLASHLLCWVTDQSAQTPLTAVCCHCRPRLDLGFAACAEDAAARQQCRSATPVALFLTAIAPSLAESLIHS